MSVKILRVASPRPLCVHAASLQTLKRVLHPPLERAVLIAQPPFGGSGDGGGATNVLVELSDAERPSRTGWPMPSRFPSLSLNHAPSHRFPCLDSSRRSRRYRLLF